MKLIIVGPSDSGKTDLANYLHKHGFSPLIEVSDRVGGSMDDGAAILKLEDFHFGVKDVPTPARLRKHSDLTLFMKTYGRRLLEGDGEAKLQFRELLDKWGA